MNNTKVSVYVINLPKSFERKKFMEEQLNSHGITAHFVSAVNGYEMSESDIESVFDEKLCIDKLGRKLSRGEIGCYLSHFSVYQIFISDENAEWALILEDDVFLKEEFYDFFKSINKMPKDIEYLNFANFPDSSFFFKTKNRINKFKIKEHVAGVWGTYAYLISRSAADKLIQQALPIHMPIDYLGRVYGTKLDCLVVHPYCAYTEVDQIHGSLKFPSTIGLGRSMSEKKKRWISAFAYRIKVFVKRFGF